MSVRRILSVSLTVLVLAALLPLLPLTHVNAATAPSLGAAASFVVLGGSAVTNTGLSVIIGDVGLSPGTSITGFPPGIVVPPGTIHQTDTVAANAQSDTTTAYNALAAQGPGTMIAAGSLGGLSLVPGVYTVPAATSNLEGTLTLSSTSADDVWIFLMPSTLITSSSSVVTITGPGSPCNVFWQVTSSATLGSGSTFVGTIIALQSISLTDGASVSGRLLARNGAVTLINNAVTLPTCAGVTPGGVGVSKIFSPSTISEGGVSTLTITFTNTNPGDATLLSDFTDNLPSGLVIAGTPNLHFTGGSGTPTATPGGSTVTLPAGSTIPGGSLITPGFAILTVDVTSQHAGAYTNTLRAGVLHTDKGDNLFITPPAGATVVVSPRALPVGGVVVPTSKLEILTPYLALAGLLVAVSAVVVVKKRRD